MAVIRTTLCGTRRPKSSCAVGLIIMLLLVGCATQHTTHPTSLTAAISIPITNLNPQLTGNVLDGNVLSNLYDGLFNVDPNGDVVPALATSMKISDSGKVATIELRRGVTFHNGDPFTAEDVKFSFDRVRDPNVPAPYRDDLAGVSAVEIRDPNTIVLKLRDRDPLLENKLAGVAAMILPKKYFESKGASEFAKHPVGTGPFQFTSQIVGQTITLEAFDNFWGKRKPAFREIIFKIVPQAATRLALLESGEVKIANNLDTSVVGDITAHGLSTVSVSSGGTMFLQASEEDPRLRPLEVRQALNYAINRSAIVTTILKGFGTPVGSVMSPDLPGFDQAVIPPYPYDPDKAKDLLAKSGIDLTLPFDMDVPTGRYTKAPEFSQAIIADLAAVGMKVDLHLLDYSQWLKRNEDHTISTLFPDNLSPRLRDILGDILGSFGCDQLYSFTCNPEFDRRVEAANQLTGKARVEATRALMQSMHDTAQAVFLWTEEAVVGLSRDLDWKPIPASPVLNFRAALPSGV